MPDAVGEEPRPVVARVMATREAEPVSQFAGCETRLFGIRLRSESELIQDRYGGTGKLAVTFVSFGFKHGLPLEFNLVFDVRFLPNPYFEPALTHLDGRDPECA